MANKADLIFMKWKADLAELDRSKDMVEGNFELLFDQMFRARIKMDLALPFLDLAIKAHYPSDSVIKGVFRKMKQYPGYSNLEVFTDSWKDLISNTAKRVFFAFYEIGGIQEASGDKIGGRSKSQRVKEQNYANSFQLVDWESMAEENEEKLSPDKLDSINTSIDLGDL